MLRPLFAFCAAAIAVLSLALPAQETGDRPAPPDERPSTYRLDARLDPAAKSLSVREVVEFTNPSAYPLGELRLHVYMNAFRDLESTFMREATPAFRARWRERDFSKFECTRSLVRTFPITPRTPAGGDGSGGSAAGDPAGDSSAAGTAPVESIVEPEFVAPDDGNAVDATVMRIPLPSPLAPGQRLELELDYVQRLPKALRRTGWVPGNGFFCMHWYPILGVVEDRDAAATWNCHQFHAHTEFFADFARYDVTLRVPDNYVVGATGGREVDVSFADGRRVLRFEQDRVHDFAWVADPDFVVTEEKIGPFSAAEDVVAAAVAEVNGVEVAEYDVPEVAVRLLLQPEHDTAAQRERHFRAVATGLAFFGRRFGPYPYSMLTVVDPGRDATGTSLGGGMEYPTLITCGTELFPHRRRLRPESVTVHEFGHQYWFGLSANNQFEEAWLDEGLTTYCEGRAQDLAFGHERPLQATSFGMLTLGTNPGFVPFVGELATVTRLPRAAWADIPIVGESLDDLGYTGRLLPESPLLDVLGTLPTLAQYREVWHSDAWNDRKRFLDAATPDAMVRPGWQYVDRSSYSTNSYTRPATVLRTLERHVGQAKWWAFLREFHQQSRFRHPTTGEFRRLLAERCGVEADAYFRSVIGAQATFDYGIGEVVATGPRKSVIVRRYGSVVAEVPIRFEYADGTVEQRTMSATDIYPWKRFQLDHPADLVRVDLDPVSGQGLTAPGDGSAEPDAPETGEPTSAPPAARARAAVRPPGLPGGDPPGPAGVHFLDANVLNNSWSAEPEPRPALYRGFRTLLQVQSRLSFAGWIG